jgi:hypothetical protein
MKRYLCATLPLLLIMNAAAAAAKADLSGTWVFNPSKSKNVGMMSGLQLTKTIKQSQSALTIRDDSKFNGQDSSLQTHYDLGGKPMRNQTFMGENAETVTHWAGSSLVTTWKTEGAIAGSTVVRTETLSVSADGKTLTMESVRGTNPAIAMVFDRQQ